MVKNVLMIIDGVKKIAHSSKTISDGYFLGTHFRFYRPLIDSLVMSHHIYATHTHFASIIKIYMQLLSNPHFIFFNLMSLI